MADSNPDASSIAPGFLVAAPKLEDGPFEKAVILMVHHDADGAMGFIVNKPIEMDFGSLLESVEQPVSIGLDESAYDQTVFFGGPVRVEQLWLLYHHAHGSAPVGDPQLQELQEAAEMAFHPDWVLAGAGSIIESFAAGHRQEPYHPVLGYAGWGPGQLEEELEDGSWLAIDFEQDLLLETPPGRCWEAALETVGLDAATFMMMGRGGHA